MNKRNFLIIFICFLLGVSYALVDRLFFKDEDFALIEIWEAADGNLIRDMSPTQLQPVDEGEAPENEKSVFSLGEAKKFLTEVAPQVMKFGFHDYENKKELNARYFTKRGFVSFYTALNKAQIPEYLHANKILINSEMICLVGVEPGHDKYGRPFWEFNFILALNYQNGNLVRQDWQNVTARIINKQNESLSYQLGLGIRQWVAIPLSNEQEARNLCPSENDYEQSR